MVNLKFQMAILEPWSTGIRSWLLCQLLRNHCFYLFQKRAFVGWTNRGCKSLRDFGSQLGVHRKPQSQTETRDCTLPTLEMDASLPCLGYLPTRSLKFDIGIKLALAKVKTRQNCILWQSETFNLKFFN